MVQLARPVIVHGVEGLDQVRVLLGGVAVLGELADDLDDADDEDPRTRNTTGGP